MDATSRNTKGGDQTVLILKLKPSLTARESRDLRFNNLSTSERRAPHRILGADGDFNQGADNSFQLLQNNSTSLTVRGGCTIFSRKFSRNLEPRLFYVPDPYPIRLTKSALERCDIRTHERVKGIGSFLEHR